MTYMEYKSHIHAIYIIENYIPIFFSTTLQITNLFLQFMFSGIYSIRCRIFSFHQYYQIYLILFKLFIKVRKQDTFWKLFGKIQADFF